MESFEEDHKTLDELDNSLINTPTTKNHTLTFEHPPLGFKVEEVRKNSISIYNPSIVCDELSY